MTTGFQVRPDNFGVMVAKNRQGPKPLAEAAPFNLMTVEQVEAAIAKGAKIVDTRVPSAFGAAYIRGAVNIGLTPASVNWLGMVVPADTDIIIVADTAARAEEAARIYRRAGYDRLIGYLGDGISSWAALAKPLDHLPQVTPQSLKRVFEKYPNHLGRCAFRWRMGVDILTAPCIFRSRRSSPATSPGQEQHIRLSAVRLSRQYRRQHPEVFGLFECLQPHRRHDCMEGVQATGK